MKKISKNILNNPRDISLFEGNYTSVFLYKKTEKISIAIYLITTFLSDNDPVKLKLRTVSLALVSQSLAVAFPPGGAHESIDSKQLTSTILLLASLLEIAFVNSLVSQMNYSVLHTELEALIRLIEDSVHRENLLLPLVISPDFFTVPFANENFYQPKMVQGTKISQTGIDITAQRKEVFYKGHNNVSYKNTSTQINKKDNLQKGHDLNERKDVRLKSIISLLEKAPDLTIKDFSAVIKDCSEKTIQRELLSLVAKGVLKKEGERRWSKYSLVQTQG